MAPLPASGDFRRFSKVKFPDISVMKTIIPPSAISEKLLGSRRVRSSASYRESAFLIRIPCEDGTLLFHALTGELLLLDHHEVLTESDELIQSGFFVRQDFDERKQVRDMRHIMSMLHPRKHITDYTILTTTDCNARCFYCYENGVPHFPMSPETANETAAHIVRMSGGGDVKLHWFGGEPLYNRQAIEIVTRVLREQGISFTSRMTTNGYYLDADTLRTAVNEWNLRSIQISLDGTRDNYNRVKAYIDADVDPFNRVLDHIGNALEAGLSVSIRLNVGKHNADDLQQLAELLADRFPERDRLHVYPALVVNFSPYARETVTQSEKIRFGTELVEKLYRLGLVNPGHFSNEPRLCRCMADNDRCEVIFPDGQIARCQHIEEGISVGHIRGDRYDLSAIEEWKAVRDFPDCLTCPLYPRCVNLMKCRWIGQGCTESARAMKRSRLEHELLAVYDNAKKEQNTEAYQ